MDVFVARQPIFDAQRRVVAYELLFRSGFENCFPKVDVDNASSMVIRNVLMVFGMPTLSAGKKVFINTTRKVLCDGLWMMLPPEQAVVELLETVKADAQTVAACQEVKAAGYQIALDDFVEGPDVDPFVPLADIVKVDVLATTPQEEERFIRRWSRRPARNRPHLLAEKVESEAVFLACKEKGYTLFQGYFFARPEIVRRQAVPANKVTYMQFLRELQRPEIDFERMEQVVKRDVSLSMNLLKYLNSAAFGWRERVTSLRHALVLLGERPFRRWGSLLAISGMAEDRPPELALTCLVRAHFCEALARELRLEELSSFMVGLFSAMDALVGRPLGELLEEMNAPRDIQQASVADDTALGKVRAAVIAYERGWWDDLGRLVRALGVDEKLLPTMYERAVKIAGDTLPPA